MSNPNSIQDQDESLRDDAPRLEPWLAMMLIAIIPMLAAFAVSRDFVMHLAAISGILFAAGTAMLIVQERRKR